MTVKLFAVVPPEILNPVLFAVKVKPLMVPKDERVGLPDPTILPLAVKVGNVSPVVEIVPLIDGAVRVLFVKISVVELVINPVLFVH